jgi:hypothetical protein
MRANQFPRYRRLLGLYPAAYREKYGDQMIQTLTDMLADTKGESERRLVWARVAIDFPASVTKAQLQYMGGIMRDETPRYIKETGLLSGLLVLPFFTALAANGLDKLFNDHTLYQSWLWRMPFLGIWVLWLPAAALIMAGLIYLKYAVIDKLGSKSSWISRIFDIKRVWPLLLPGAIAFGILFILAFHDSAHCWAQNPIYFATKSHQTWQCTTQGFLGGSN